MSDRLRRFLPILLAAAVLPYFVDLGGASIWDANEAFYVETPREMIESGDYVYPTFNYEPRTNKPVLSYWIVAALYHLFGVSVTVERWAIAVGGVGLIVIAFWLGWAAAPRERAVQTALWSATGLAAAPRLLMFSRRIFIDIYTSLFMGLTLLFYVLAERYPEHRRRWLVLMYVVAGLGVLTKGPVAVVLPAIAFAAYLLWYREGARLREMMLPLGFLIVAAIVLPWYVALYQRTGWNDIAAFIVGENLERFTEGTGAAQRGRGVWFYLPVVLTDSFPWSLLLFAAAVAVFRSRRASVSDVNSRVHVLLLLWIASFIVFFSLSATKQDLYIFPIVPAIAALSGWAIARDVAGLRPTAVILGLLFAAAGALLLFLFRSAGAIYALEGITAVAVCGVVTGLVTLTLALARHAIAAFAAVLAGAVVLNWIFVLVVLPSFEKYKPSPQLSAMLLERTTGDDMVVVYSVDMPSLVYYMRRHVPATYEEGRFLEMMAVPKRIFALMWHRDYIALQQKIPVPTCIVHRTPLFDIKARALLRREALPELVVITNHCSTP